jgi:ATPase subunit of ABC transporter with duplicated ATPase domains
MIPDDGIIKWLPGLKLGYLDQYAVIDDAATIREYLYTAYAGLFDIERKLDEINQILTDRYDVSLSERRFRISRPLRRAISIRSTGSSDVWLRDWA